MAILPFLSAPEDSLLARELYAGFIHGLRNIPSIRFMTGSSLERQLRDRPVRDVVKSPTTIAKFAQDSGSTAVVGGLVQRPDSGGVEVALVVYIQDEQGFSTIENRWYRDEEAARAEAAGLARTLTHPRNLTSADAAFFYSMIVPGAGQFSLGKWKHGAFFLALTGAAVAYRATIPNADAFRLRATDFTKQFDWNDQAYRYYAFGVEVSAAEYDALLSEARGHSIRAANERRRTRVRRERATVFLIGSWLLNIVDSLLVSRRNPDTAPFFSLAESISRETGEPLLRLQLTWPISP